MDKSVLVLDGLAATIWTIIAISAYINTGHFDTLKTISAVLWGIIFAVQMKRYLKRYRQK